jgi:CHASE3 domain sensor protein
VQRFEVPIRPRIAGGLILAVLLAIFLAFWSWHSARRAEQDSYSLSHTYEVMATIQRTSRHVVEAETSARSFTSSGQEPLLAHFAASRANCAALLWRSRAIGSKGEGRKRKAQWLALDSRVCDPSP